MKTAIRKIGNSKGVILPDAILKAFFIDNEVIMELKDNHIVINPPNDTRRKNWEEGFKEMAANGDDPLVIPASFNDEKNPDWKKQI